MSNGDCRLFLLICGKDKRERAQFLDELYRSLHRNRQVLRPAGARNPAVGDEPSRYEIALLSEARTGDASHLLFNGFPNAPVIAASLSYAAAADLPVSADSDRVRTIDLNRRSPREAKREALRAISRLDAERIGSFAGVAGIVEVGLGSILHTYKIPLKGHFLCGIQNILLISFGKSLKGRGLTRISFISAMLKGFSPMGGALSPMLFIFLQGAIFALPTRLLGWRAVSAIAGSVLMGWLTLGISFGMDYLMFGKRIFEAAQSGIHHLLSSVGLGSPSLSQLLLFAFVLRAAVSVAIGSVAYFGNILPTASRIAEVVRRRRGTRAEPTARVPKKQDKEVPVAIAALSGIFRPKFLLALLFSVLLMRFFTNLTSTELATVAVRGICISYLGFLLMHRVDVRKLGAYLDRRFGLDLEKSLPIAVRRLGRSPRRGGR